MGRLIDEENRVNLRLNAPRENLIISKLDVINLIVVFFLVGLAFSW